MDLKDSEREALRLIWHLQSEAGYETPGAARRLLDVATEACIAVSLLRDQTKVEEAAEREEWPTLLGPGPTQARELALYLRDELALGSSPVANRETLPEKKGGRKDLAWRAFCALNLPRKRQSWDSIGVKGRKPYLKEGDETGLLGEEAYWQEIREGLQSEGLSLEKKLGFTTALLPELSQSSAKEWVEAAMIWMEFKALRDSPHAEMSSSSVTDECFLQLKGPGLDRIRASSEKAAKVQADAAGLCSRFKSDLRRELRDGFKAIIPHPMRGTRPSSEDVSPTDVW